MVWWLQLAVMHYMLKRILLSVLLQSLNLMMASTRLECNRTRFEQTCEDSYRIWNYLSNDTVRRTHMPTVNCGSRRWFHTPDGVPPYTPINGSSSKYFIQNDNNLLLNLTDVSASHEGIYGCSTNNEGYDLEVCVKVYGTAAFASCPHESTCRETETIALPANRGSVRFNATVIYIPGGGCGYRQSLNFIKLRKIDEMTGDTLKFLYICRFNGGTCDSNEKTSVTLSRGHLGNDFVLTLSNLTADSIGAYEVIVDRSSPDSGSTQPLSKKFRLVEPASTSTLLPSKTMAMTSMQTISPSPTVTPSDENGPSSTRTLPINAIIVLSLVAAIIGTTSITSIIIAVVLTRKARSRKRVGSIGGTSEQRSHELDAYTPIRPQPEQARYDRERTMFLQYSSRGGNEENNTVTGEISMDSMELPQPFDAISIIDDVELPNDDSQMNSNGVPC